MNKKKVCITIKSTQTAENDKDTTELFTFGFLEKKKTDTFRITYEESEATGFAGSNVTLDVNGTDLVTMVRKGKSSSNLTIERGKKHHCHYGTEFGDFMVGIKTDEIRSSLDENGGELYLKYTIDINASFMSENEMFINIKECNANE